MSGNLLTIDEAAAYCGVSVSTFRRLYVRKDYPRVQIASCVRFDVEDLDRWLKLASRRTGQRRRSRNGEPSVYVMLVRGLDVVKIGWSRNPEARVAWFGKMLGLETALARVWAGSVNDERAVHDRFASSRIGTSEWFVASPEVIAFVESTP